MTVKEIYNIRENLDYVTKDPVLKSYLIKLELRVAELEHTISSLKEDVEKLIENSKNF